MIERSDCIREDRRNQAPRVVKMSRHGVTALAFTALLAGALGAALQESPDPTCQTGISEGKAFCCPKVRCLECTVLLSA
jgi:hypothetical protein